MPRSIREEYLSYQKEYNRGRKPRVYIPKILTEEQKTKRREYIRSRNAKIKLQRRKLIYELLASNKLCDSCVRRLLPPAR